MQVIEIIFRLPAESEKLNELLAPTAHIFKKQR